MKTRFATTAITAFFCAAALTISATAATAGTIAMQWKTDKEPVSYQPGDTMTFTLQLVEDNKPLAGKTLKWTRYGDDGKTTHGEAKSDVPLAITTSLDKPGFVHIVVAVFGADRKPVKNAKGQPLVFEGGAGVEPQKLESYPEPTDFDAFWKAQKERLAQVPIKAELKEVKSNHPNFTVYDVKIDCAGGKPVSGYLSIPKNAKPKSLAAQVCYQGYGVNGAAQAFAPNTISLQINAHGIENGRELAYYEALKNGALKSYAFNNKENAKPETAYFNGMMLRVIRSLQYIKTRPEWDGKTLKVSGGSQGGLQCLTAAALDQDVTGCTAWKPWCCDLAGIKSGRLRGWRPDWTDALGYYDPVNMAKRIKCETLIFSGLGDYTCPPSGLSTLYNNIKAKKTINYVQGTTHGYDPANPTKQTLWSK